MMSDETYNDLMEFIPYEDVEFLEELTGFGEDEILVDYTLYCDLLKLPVNIESWKEYKDETENQF